MNRRQGWAMVGKDEGNGEEDMSWRSTACLGESRHKLHNGEGQRGGKTFCKTSISMLKPMETAAGPMKSSPVDDNRGQLSGNEMANQDRHCDSSRYASVSLVISRNQNASVSASCFFPQTKECLLPTSFSELAKEKGGPSSSRRVPLKIVEIPFEEPMPIGEEITKAKTFPRKTEKYPNFPAPFNYNPTNEKLFPSRQKQDNGDYRVICLDAKPRPGRLEDFVPDIERNNTTKTGLEQNGGKQLPTFGVSTDSTCTRQKYSKWS